MFSFTLLHHKSHPCTLFLIFHTILFIFVARCDVLHFFVFLFFHIQTFYVFSSYFSPLNAFLADLFFWIQSSFHLHLQIVMPPA